MSDRLVRFDQLAVWCCKISFLAVPLSRLPRAGTSKTLNPEPQTSPQVRFCADDHRKQRPGNVDGRAAPDAIAAHGKDAFGEPPFPFRVRIWPTDGTGFADGAENVFGRNLDNPQL